MGDTFFSHAAIVIGYYNLDHKTQVPSSDACVTLEDGGRDPGCEVVIADALPGDEDGEVALRDLHESNFGDGEFVEQGEEFQAVRLSGLSFATRSEAANELMAYLLAGGAANPANQSATDWNADALDYDLLFTARGPGSFYCSSLVWWAYDQAGVQLNGNDAWYALIDRAYVTPDDLIESNGAEWLLGGVPPQTVVSTQSANSATSSASGASSARSALAAGDPANGGAHVMLVDDQGRRTGKDKDGVLHQEIPGAWWKSSEWGESVSANGGGLDWTIVLGGYADADYVAFVRSLGGGLESGAIVGRAEPGVEREIAWSDLDEVANLPIAIDDALSAVSGTSGSLSPAANDLDPDEDLVPGSLSIVSGPAHGTASVGTGGSVSYRSSAGYTGPDQIRYRICDAKGRCDEAFVTVTVAPAPPGGGSTGDGSGGGPLLDTTAPLTSLLGKRSQKLGKFVSVTVACKSEACTAVATGSVSLPGAARAARTFRLKKVTKRIPGGGRATLRLKLSKQAHDAIERSLRKRKKVNVKLKLVVSDAAGNRRTLRRTVTLKR
jgi:hypothetical protein